MKRIVVIAGVTGAGKTKLGVSLAKELGGEIISADSVAIYRELNIGSAKPSFEEQSGVPHHLIDIKDVTEKYDVMQFQRDSRKLIDEIIDRGNLPIIVGGTGLYSNALLYDYQFKEQETSKEYADSISNEELYDMLKEQSLEEAEKIHPNNRKRVIRSLNRLELGQASENARDKPYYNAKVYFLQGDREYLYDRMNRRVDIMFEAGLEKEVTSLYQKYSNLFSFQGLNSIGYREFEAYFLGNQTLEETNELIKRNTRRFSKRQRTWFKHQTPSEWIDVEQDDFEAKILSDIKIWLKE
ncbi:MAG: tRNA (adenosine(37)-N6)-dimethylallyltransferase MiaA [Erysipelothrix sp.]